MKFLALMTAALAAFATPALAEPMSADAKAGKAVTKQWCSLCHAESGAPPPKSEAPTFADIVADDERDADYLARILREDHFPMTTYRLFDHERDQVLQYFLWLKQEQKKQAGTGKTGTAG